ncbi:SUMF1/EgtB/PvdO family nonheme iron enzyme [Desulfobacter latus]|uniref:SUMF1/EgtB/PvdO family nonheme iron enzyme n=1 Tax=Desulfobacter latus TaxID=2292 RepID=A0A850T8P3_9BACT|nr:SUMF1/EgtB/PvdO family nonheme iron enzyme [Desulfobacter latus]NWH04818.1 SUMF1/EgtB/PvdO family nonheme iron enzyme [Desulfobacter latus]
MKQQGLFIGVNEYEKDSGLGSLKFAEKDADHISKIFSSRYGFEVDTLLGKAATRAGIEDALDNYRGGDLFVLFYAGHGGEHRGQYNLFPSGSNANGRRALDFSVLSRILQYDLGFSKILILLDACRNENRVYDNKRRSTPGFYASRDIEAVLMGDSYVDIIYGCGEGQVSYEAEELEHGLLRTCAPKADKQPDEPDILSPCYVLCPLCGRRNEEINTFKCLSCGKDYLCLTHQDANTYVCEQCQAAHQKKKIEQDGIRRAQEKEKEALRIEKERQKQRQQEKEQKQREAERLAREGLLGKAWKDPKTGMAFVWVPGGTFDMGDTFGDGKENEQPVHKVKVGGFYMGKYQVTQGEWVKVMDKKSPGFWSKIIGFDPNPSDFKKGDRYPVENVSWNMIVEQFIPALNKLSDQTYRLPTEAEWEYAARSGGKKEKYAGGDDVDALAWYDDNSNNSTHEVGTKAPNGLGLYDMSGNVWEWCEDDWHNNYDGAPDDGTAWMDSPRGADRVVRGGGWDSSARYVRSANRGRDTPDYRNGNLGFRLVFQAVK